MTSPSGERPYFSHDSLAIFDGVYSHFTNAFCSGQILLGGSLYYHITKMAIFRLPGDLDVIVEAKNTQLQKDISFFLDSIAMV